MLRYEFHRHNEARIFPSGLVNLAETPLADVLQDHVVLHAEARRGESMRYQNALNKII